LICSIQVLITCSSSVEVEFGERVEAVEDEEDGNDGDDDTVAVAVGSGSTREDEGRLAESSKALAPKVGVAEWLTIMASGVEQEVVAAGGGCSDGGAGDCSSDGVKTLRDEMALAASSTASVRLGALVPMIVL